MTLGPTGLRMPNRPLTFFALHKRSQLQILSFQAAHLLHNIVESLIDDSRIAWCRHLAFKNLVSFLSTFVFLGNSYFFGGRDLLLALISIETLTLDLESHIWQKSATSLVVILAILVILIIFLLN